MTQQDAVFVVLHASVAAIYIAVLGCSIMVQVMSLQPVNVDDLCQANEQCVHSASPAPRVLELQQCAGIILHV